MNGDATTIFFSLEGQSLESRSELQLMPSSNCHSGVVCKHRDIEEMEEGEELELEAKVAEPEVKSVVLEAGELLCDAESDDGCRITREGEGTLCDGSCIVGVLP